MKTYFFSNQSWGHCYTVMANNMKEAIKVVKKHIADDEKEGKSNKPCVEPLIRKVGEVKLRSYGTQMHKFDIREYRVKEVIDTEYS